MLPALPCDVVVRKRYRRKLRWQRPFGVGPVFTNDTSGPQARTSNVGVATCTCQSASELGLRRSSCNSSHNRKV